MVQLLLGGPEGGTEQIVVGDVAVRLTAGTPVTVAREAPIAKAD